MDKNRIWFGLVCAADNTKPIPTFRVILAEKGTHNQGWTLAPVRPPAAGNFGVGRVDCQKYPSGWRVTFLTN